MPNGVKKIAYAASFGTDKGLYSDKMISECRKLIDLFDLVTVRETSGQALVENMFAKSTNVVVDPTLLHGKNVYIDVAYEVPCSNKGNIFCYVLDRTAEISELIYNTEKKLGRESFEVMPKSFDENFSVSDHDYVFPGIERWIAAFRDADYIITDSFHGCVFSIIFNKPFVAIGNLERGISRFESLLQQFNLADRLVTSKIECLSNILTRTIDWKSVNQIRDELYSKSMDSLITGLKIER